MNILFIHETEYIEKMIFEYQIIPEILASRKHCVFVVDFPDHKTDISKRPLILAQPEMIQDVSRAKKHGTVTVIRPARIQIPVISRYSTVLSYYFLINKIIVENEIDVIVLFSAPTNGVQTLLAAKKHKIPVYFRLLDVLHQLVPVKILQWPAYVFEKIVYRNVDQLSAITPRLRDYAIRMGANPMTSHYLPSGSDADLFFPQTKDTTLMSRYGIKPKDIVLLFSGTLYNFSGLDKVISKLPDVVKSNPNLKLLIVGSGEQDKKLRELVCEFGLEEYVSFSGFVNYQDLPRYINLADICINPFEINQITNIIFPGKIYQYLACGKPVVATKLQGMLDVFPVGDSTSGIYYVDRVEEIFDLMEKIRDDEVKDRNPSLQIISSIMENDLLSLCDQRGKFK